MRATLATSLVGAMTLGLPGIDRAEAAAPGGKLIQVYYNQGATNGSYGAAPTGPAPPAALPWTGADLAPTWLATGLALLLGIGLLLLRGRHLRRL